MLDKLAKTIKEAITPSNSYEVELAEHKDMPGTWIVEAIDSDGGIEQAIFAGPKARKRAEAYCQFQYRLV